MLFVTVVVACFVSIAGAVSAAPAPANNSMLLPKHVINLDLKPEERYTPLIKKHKTYLKEILLAIEVLFGHSAVAKDLVKTIQIPDEYKREMQGIADVGGVSYDQVLTANMYYEISGVSGVNWNTTSQSCTSIAAQNANGTVYLARNQDYPTLFSPLLYDAIYTRGGKTVYRGTSFVGTIGIETGFVKDVFAVSVNARGNFRPNKEQAHKQCEDGATFFPLATRMAMEHAAAGKASTYQDAVKYIVDIKMVMPGYFIVAGGHKGEGAIVTRNYTAGAAHNDVLSLFSSREAEAPVGQGTWFVVQTNDDHWKPPEDLRRNSAIRDMDKISAKHADFDGLWTVLNTPPVYNPSTIHTDLVDVHTGDYRTYLQHTI